MFFPLSDNNPTQRKPVVTVSLIAVNVLALLWLSRMTEFEQTEAVAHHGFVPARIAQLTRQRPIDLAVPPEVQQIELFERRVIVPAAIRLQPNAAEIYQSIITTMFLHGGWMHLIGNMWFLWLFGNNIEDRLGHFVFLAFYVIGGLLATLCQYAQNPASAVPVIGASGAVAAVLGAYAVTFPLAKVRCLVFLFIIITVIEVPAFVVLGLWFLEQSFEALKLLQLNRMPVGVAVNVAWWAHFGGFIAGAILMPLLGAGAPPPGENWHKEAESMFDFSSSS